MDDERFNCGQIPTIIGNGGSKTQRNNQQSVGFLMFRRLNWSASYKEYISEPPFQAKQVARSQHY